MTAGSMENRVNRFPEGNVIIVRQKCTVNNILLFKVIDFFHVCLLRDFKKETGCHVTV